MGSILFKALGTLPTEATSLLNTTKQALVNGKDYFGDAWNENPPVRIQMSHAAFLMVASAGIRDLFVELFGSDKLAEFDARMESLCAAYATKVTVDRTGRLLSSAIANAPAIASGANMFDPAEGVFFEEATPNTDNDDDGENTDNDDGDNEP